jgi:hypothetical protein
MIASFGNRVARPLIVKTRPSYGGTRFGAHNAANRALRALFFANFHMRGGGFWQKFVTPSR